MINLRLLLVRKDPVILLQNVVVIAEELKIHLDVHDEEPDVGGALDNHEVEVEVRPGKDQPEGENQGAQHEESDYTFEDHEGYHVIFLGSRRLVLFLDLLIFGDQIDQGGHLISVLDGSEHRIVSVARVIIPVH